MICCVVVLFLLIWSVFLRVWHNTESRCTVKAERNLFSVIMEFMNESKSEAFQLEEGASLVVYIEHLDGELDIFITDSNGKSIYEGHNPEMSTFLVNITENGQYTITVEGKRAKGSISFRIIRRNEE